MVMVLAWNSIYNYEKLTNLNSILDGNNFASSKFKLFRLIIFLITSTYRFPVAAYVSKNSASIMLSNGLPASLNSARAFLKSL